LEDAGSTAQIRLPRRRRQLRGVVIAAVSACALILVAAGIVRVVHASSEPERTAHASANANTVDTQAASPGSTTGGAGGGAAPAAAGGSSAPSTASGGTSAPTSGTLHLERGLAPRLVVLDGKKLTSHNETVSCGPHTIKVGRGRPRAIDVPCGGELKISR
jgi:hypothetical protein